MNFDDWIKVCETAGGKIDAPDIAYAEMLPLIEDFTKEACRRLLYGSCGVDDWLSLVDSKLSYEENKTNFVQNFGALNSDDDLMRKYRNYQDMAQDEYRNT